MPKRKTTPETEPSVGQAADVTSPKARKSAASKAAPHKHTRKSSKSMEVEMDTPAAVAAAVTPVQETVQTPARVVAREEIARLAYSYWEARGYQGGSAEEDWFRAERELTILA